MTKNDIISYMTWELKKKSCNLVGIFEAFTNINNKQYYHQQQLWKNNKTEGKREKNEAKEMNRSPFIF